MNNTVRKNIGTALWITLCIFINYFGKTASDTFSLPIWLDHIGTALAAYFSGPFCGVVTGVTVNIMYSMSNTIALWYIPTSVLLGLSIGLLANKNVFTTVFSANSFATVIALLISLIYTPINTLVNNHVIGNVWGDGIYEMLSEMGMPGWTASFIGLLFVEYLDKALMISVLFFAIKLHQQIHSRPSRSNTTMPVSIIVSALLLSGFCAHTASAATEPDYSKYIQFIYSNDNGLLSGEANDIVETKDGVLWIGTYAGLYRYNGSEFTYIKHFPSVKNANCLMVDEEGRLWIGTNDSGLSICIKDEIANTLDQRMGLPSNSVRSIVRQSTGRYFVGTSSELAIITLSGGIRVYDILPDIVYAQSLAADDQEHVAAVTATGQLFLIKDLDIVDRIEGSTTYTSVYFAEDGYLYAGTAQGSVVIFDVTDNLLRYVSEIKCGDAGEVNSINQTENGLLIACCESGAVCISQDGTPSPLNLKDFNSKIEHVVEDYQGNLWFSSSRCGIVKLCKSPFSELYVEANLPAEVANAVTLWQGAIYVGTDAGLDIIDKATLTPIKNNLTEQLEGTRIRCVARDSQDNLWISTYRKGVIRLDYNHNITVFDATRGMHGTRYRFTYELKDGTIAVSGDDGMDFLQGDTLVSTIGADNGLNNNIILCMLEDKSGRLLLGTDGGGINVAQNGKVQSYITREQGLGSDVILRMVPDPDADGIFVITSNGISYLSMEGNEYQARVLDNFPYNNNYDLYDDGDGKLFVTSSAGIYVVEKKELLSGNAMTYELLNSLNGLRGVLTANAWNYVDQDNIWYIASGSGVSRLNLTEYQASVRSYRMLLNSYTVDGEKFKLEQDKEIFLKRNASRFELAPEIINYSTKDPYVSYYLVGVDNEPTIVRQSELQPIVYTNIPVGTYRFILSVIDEEQNRNIEEHTYTIVKESVLHDHWWFRLGFILEAILLISWITLFFSRMFIQRTIDLQRKQIELAKKKIQMGNQTILAIARTVDAKDSNTSQHSTRVSEYSVMIAERLGYSKERIENLRQKALLHDIGKIGIPDSVLNKPARLTDEEYAIMKSHVVVGGEILKEFTLVEDVCDAVMYHHERWDGKGYMKGLKGEEIPEAARIVGIADAFDAMTANRVYRKKLDFDHVLDELRKGRGTQFDPHLVDVFLELIDEGKIDVEAIYAESLQNQREEDK